MTCEQCAENLTGLIEGDPLYGVFPEMVNIVLASIFVNEIASPFLLRHAILRGNEMETE